MQVRHSFQAELSALFFKKGSEMSNNRWVLNFFRIVKHFEKDGSLNKVSHEKKVQDCSKCSL